MVNRSSSFVDEHFPRKRSHSGLLSRYLDSGLRLLCFKGLVAVVEGSVHMASYWFVTASYLLKFTESGELKVAKQKSMYVLHILE